MAKRITDKQINKFFFWEAEELHAREVQDDILNAIPDKHRFIFFFLTRQGLRPGEVVALKWGDIDLDNGIITVNRTMSNRKILERTKTKKVRPRLLHPDIVEMLRSMTRGLPEDFIFINPNTERPYVGGVSIIFYYRHHLLCFSTINSTFVNTVYKEWADFVDECHMDLHLKYWIKGLHIILYKKKYYL